MRHCCAFALLSLFLSCPLPVVAVAPLDFAKDVLPMLEKNCLPCHNATKSEGDLNIETPQLMLKGGEHGASIMPHKGLESLLYQSAARTKKPHMPPAENKSKALPLTSLQLELLRRWIDEGAVGEGKKREAPQWQHMPSKIESVGAVAVSDDGSLVAAARGGRVTIYDVGSKSVAAELPANAHRDVVTSLAFSPDALTLVTGSFGEVKMWTRPAPVASAEQDRATKLLKAERAVMATTFESSWQKAEQERLDKLAKGFADDAKKSATELAEFARKKSQNEKAVIEAQNKLETTKADRVKADAAASAATLAKVKAEEARKAGGDAAALSKALEAAAKVEADAQKEQKKKVEDYNNAAKALSEAKSEIGKAIDAERTAKKAEEDLAETKKKLETVKKAASIAEAARLAAEKALAALKAEPKNAVTTSETKEPSASPALPAPAITWTLRQTLGDPTKPTSVLTDRVNALAFSPDGKLFATGSGDPSRSGEIKLWETKTGKLVRAFAKPHKDAVLCLEFSDDGKLLASGSADRAVRLWEVSSGKLVRSLEAHSNHVLAVSLRHDARMLVSASADASVKTWTLDTGDVVKTFSDFKKEITGAHYVGLGDEVAGIAGDPVTWSLKDGDGAAKKDERGLKAYLTCFATTCDGRTQVIGDATGKVRVFDREGKLRAEW